MRSARWLCVVGGGLLVGCGSEDGDTAASGGELPPDTRIAVLGGGTHDPSAVVMTEVGHVSDGLNAPRDLAFNPSAPNQLWVVNIADNSVVLYTNAGQPGQLSQKFAGAVGSEHFLSKPTGIAFGMTGRFATIQEEDQLTQGDFTPSDFMGPTLWTADLAIFDGGNDGHIDMLHNSPLGMGLSLIHI